MTEKDPDWNVLTRVAEGDVESFGVLVERHQERLIRLCERMLGEPEEARDAAQEVFLKAFQKAGSFRPRGQVYTWLYRIAVNHCLNRLRRRKLVRFLSFGEAGPRPAARVAGDQPAPALEPADDAPDSERVAVARERVAWLEREIAGLPLPRREVLLLACVEKMPLKEVAEALGMPVNTVKTHLRRARMALAERLARRERGEVRS